MRGCGVGYSGGYYVIVESNNTELARRKNEENIAAKGVLPRVSVDKLV